MDGPIELHWTPELRDSLQATRVVAGTRLVSFFVVLVLAGVVELALHNLWLGLLALVLGPVVMLLQLLTAVLVFRKNSRDGTVDAVVDGHGVRVAHAGAATEYAWSMIAEWREASRVFVLRTGGSRALSVVLLPQRTLADEGRSALRATLTDHIGAAGARRAVQLGTSPRPQPVTTGPPDGALTPDDGGRVELHWTPERADWVEAMRTVSIVHRLLPWLAVLLVVAGAVSSAWSYHATPDGYTMNIAFVVAIPLGIFVGCITSLQARGLLRRNPLVAGEQRVILDDSGLRFSIAGTETSTDWATYAGFRERRRSFVLRHGRSSLTPVTLLAKRGVLPPNTVDDLRALLERRVGGASGHETS